MWLSDLSADRIRSNPTSHNPVLRAIIHPMSMGTGVYDDPNQQVNAPVEIHDQLSEIGGEDWERLWPVVEHYGSWKKVMWKPNKTYVEFLAQLK